MRSSSARGVSLLKLSTGAIEKRLTRLPYVRSVQVYRDFPHTLEIRLVEYEPVARVRAAEGKVWLVADDGRLLEKIDAPAPSPLPLVVPAAQFVAQPAATVPPAGRSVLLPVVLVLQAPDDGLEAARRRSDRRCRRRRGGRCTLQRRHRTAAGRAHRPQAED